jgi:hypothetical protein
MNIIAVEKSTGRNDQFIFKQALLNRSGWKIKKCLALLILPALPGKPKK